MIRFLLPVILLLAGLGGGVVAGKMMSGGGEETAADSPAEDDGHGGDEGHGAEEDDGHGFSDGHGEEADPNSPYEYVRLNNQFVVPLIRHGSVRSLVVLTLTIEVESGENELVYDREPRLRDALLRVMFSHANVGGFDGSFTAVESMAPLREGLREAARQVLGAVAHDVLIMDIVRQDA
ncbi:flagellar basal body-associated FliL family protein [Nioella ostreopsis]|uniref:flagellar basal body-associated FliL family protein n=1 Tax=Nioella ostreopsis TaxID=2448479 RepID=UPI000FD7806E|nr:flagellar basal body-associated FliL family protein [Nioella ostreopsis]